MNKIILIFSFVLFGLASVGQVAKSGSVGPGKFTEYQAQGGAVVAVNDTIKLGLPSGPDGFRFITQGGQPVAARLNGAAVVVNDLKPVGNKKTGYKMYATFKGYGLVACFIDIDAAIKTNEIELPRR